VLPYGGKFSPNATAAATTEAKNPAPGTR